MSKEGIADVPSGTQATTATVAAASAGGPATSATSAASTASSVAAGASAPVSAGPSGEVSQVAGAVREPAAYETFDWDGWTGDFDAFPEEARPWMERAGGYWQAQLEEERARAASYEDLVNNYLQGQSDDPRLAEYSTRLEQAQAAHRDLEQRYQESQAAFEAMQAEQSRSYIDRFWKDNQWLKDDEQARTELYKLIDDWEPYAAVRFLKLSKEGRAAALDAKRRGAGDDFAVEYGELKGQPVVEKPRPAAALVGGASFGSMTPDVSERSPSDAKSLDDRIRLASSKTLKRFARK